MLPILNYHNVAPVPTGMHLPQLYVSPEMFSRQLWWLRRVGLTGVTLTEGVRRLHEGRASQSIAITFDDGYADNVSNALPLLQEYGFKATCFVVSERIGIFNTWDAEKLGGRKPLMTTTDIETWLNADCEIGSHTCTHPNLTLLPREQVMEEVVSSRQRLRELVGAAPSAFCYPYGAATNDTALCVARAGYRLAVTARRGQAHADDDPLLLPRLSVNGRKGLVKFMLKAATPYADIGRLWGAA